jgi:uncharacterized membrane protein
VPIGARSEAGDARRVAVVAWALLGNIRQHPVNLALELLDERYARGEIDSDEYTERKSELSR